MKPPVALAASYARYLRKRYRAVDVDAILRGYPIKNDASDYVRKAIKSLIHTTTSDAVPPEHLEKLGEQVDKFNARGQKLLGVPNNRITTGDQVTLFREQNLSLIKTLDETMVNEIRAILVEGERTGIRVENIREQIIERVGVAESHADLIARDQVLKLNGQLTRLRQTSAGIDNYEWSTSGDERVRPGHEDLDGTVQAWAVPPEVDERSGRTAHPGEDYQCRCTAIPILD